MLGPLVICYLFLGGTGAGACLVLGLLGLLSPRDAISQRVSSRGSDHLAVVCPPEVYRRLIVPAGFVGLVALVLGIVCLLADVGRADRIELLFVSPVLSYVTVGAWSLSVCAVLAMMLVLAWSGLMRLPLVLLQVIEVVLVAVSLVVMAYTGLLLQDMSSVPLWSMPWLPVLFVLSSLSCGIALVLGTGQFSGAAQGFSTVFRRLAGIDIAAIACEVLVAAAYLATLCGLPVLGALTLPENSGTVKALSESLWMLVAGPNAWVFWGVFVMCGLVTAFVLDLVLVRARGNSNPMLALVAAMCVLAGGFALRYCVVTAGLHPVLQTVT